MKPSKELRLCLISNNNIKCTYSIVQNLEAAGKSARSSTERRTVHHMFSDLLGNMQHGGAYELNSKSFSLVMNKVNFQVVETNRTCMKDLNFL